MKYIKYVQKTISTSPNYTIKAIVKKDRWSRMFVLGSFDKKGNFERGLCLRQKEINEVIKFFNANKNYEHRKLNGNYISHKKLQEINNNGEKNELG